MVKTIISKSKQSDFIWKIIQYYNGKQVKKRIGDTYQGYKLAIEAVNKTKCYTYKVFKIHNVNWQEEIE